MPINTRHAQFEEYATRHKRARDASSGQYYIHHAGVEYLPKLTDQEPLDYESFKLRTPYFNATGRTVDGLVGMVMRKPPVIEQNGLDELIDDIDLNGSSLESIAQIILREVLIVDRIGLLVEYPISNSEGMTLAQRQQLNERPYATVYKTETIVNWKEERVNNKVQPVCIVLQESYNVSTDEYKPKYKIQYRELRLDDVNGRYVYLQRIYRQSEKSDDFIQVDGDIIPLLNNAPLNFIPFYTFGSDDNSLNLSDAPILPLADLNLAHYRVTADYENGCHFTALPMLFLKGITLDDNEKVKIGSQNAVVTNNTDADGKYIEFTGGGLSFIEGNLERKEKQMAAIGARMLEQQKTGVESEGAMQMRSNGENSVLASIAKLVSDQLSNMLMFMAEWYGVTQDVTVHLNTDYMPVNMSGQDLTALVQAYQTNAISFATLYENLVRGEIINGDRTEEDEKELIDNQTPTLITDGS